MIINLYLASALPVIPANSNLANFRSGIYEKKITKDDSRIYKVVPPLDSRLDFYQFKEKLRNPDQIIGNASRTCSIWSDKFLTMTPRQFRATERHLLSIQEKTNDGVVRDIPLSEGVNFKGERIGPYGTGYLVSYRV